MPEANGIVHLKEADLGPAYSHLHATLLRGRFAVTAELGPPRGASLAPLRRKAKLLHDWVDAANVTDGQSAVVRMASWAGCLVAMQEGLEPVMQLQCRDRNRIALQADLLGASAAGIPNVLLLTGDHPRFGDQPDAKPVFDMDSIQLVWAARTMRDQHRLLAGVGPVKSLRALEHMRREVPGMYVPDGVVARLNGVPSERVQAEGIGLCAEVIQQVKEIPGVAGVHVMAFGGEDAIPEILERAGLSKRPVAGKH